MQHNGNVGELYFSTLPSATYTNWLYVICMYYVTSSFIVSTKGKLVVDLHNFVFINPSLLVSVLSVCINFLKFLAQIVFESMNLWVKETYNLKLNDITSAYGLFVPILLIVYYL